MSEPRRWAKYFNLPEIQSARELIKREYSDKLQFIESTHKYFLDGVELECVSNVVKKWSSTDEDAMLNNVLRKAQRSGPEYKYYGMTAEQIKAQWEEIARKACDFGTECHAFGESLFYYLSGQTDERPVPKNSHEEAIEKFWNDLPECYVPVLAETKVFNTEGFAYAGTFDLLFYYVNESDPSKSGFIIFDYKTNGSLYSEASRKWGNYMFPPFDDLYEENLSHYTLQLGLYQIPLEKLGLKVVARRLIWVKPDGSYDKVTIPDMTARLSHALTQI